LDHNKSFAGFLSDWGAMGSQGRCGVPLELNCHSVHITAHQKDRLGWIAPERKAIVLAGSDEVFHLERLAEPGPDGLLLIEIPVPGNPRRFYTVEARKRAGYDVEIYGDAVVIHQVDFDRREEANVIFNPAEEVTAEALAGLISPQDENPAAAEGPNGPQGMWTVGEVFEAGSLSRVFGGEPGSGIRVEVLAETATGFDVRVSVEPSQVSVYRSLEPGWQLVGFTNPAGHVLNVIPVLTAPRLTRVQSWDAVNGELLSYGPGDPAEEQTLLQLETGDALWLLLKGDDGSPVLWEQVLIDGPRSVALPAGLSLQTWTGRTTPAAEAVAGLGGALESLHVWDGDVFLSYTAGLPDFVNKLHELHYGDAFWIRMSEAASWTQPAPN
jgi:hypothetical protein